MKKIYSGILFSAYLSITAQIGINTSNPDPSSTLEIFATNKGVSFPHIVLTDRNATSPISDPKESLLVYNTNENIVGGKGFYFWNGSKWDFVFNDLNHTLLQNLTKYYAGMNTNAQTFAYPADFYGNTNHVLNENITTNPTWTVFPELTQNIVVDRINNNALFTITGAVQANNDAGNGSVYASFGFFVDDKLVDIKPIDVELSLPCANKVFKIYGYTENLSVGNHTVKFAVRNRTSSQSNITVSYGGRNPSSSCNNTISNDEARISAITLLNQPFNF